LSLKSGLR